MIHGSMNRTIVYQLITKQIKAQQEHLHFHSIRFEWNSALQN